MKNNTMTIIKKEFARFFGDRTLVFTSIIMPGLLIYLMYSLMGSSVTDAIITMPDDTTVVYVDNMSETMRPVLSQLPLNYVCGGFQPDKVLSALADKDSNIAYLVFPPDFDDLVSTYDVASGVNAPNVKIFYNSTNTGSESAFNMMKSALDGWEQSTCNKFDINASSDVNFDCALQEEVLGNLLADLIPMLLLTLLFSGCMAVAPTSIAGEKERGTISTLLVTPLRRSHLALGKIVALSFFAILSGISSFIGIMLSLPKMLMSDELGISANVYSLSDYLLILLIILSTTLLLVSLISIISAFAKSVKSAQTMVTPLMLVIIFVGLSPMLMGSTDMSAAMFLIPLFNSVQSMSAVFAMHFHVLPVLLTILSNLVYTAISVYVLTRLFNNERVMFGR